MVVLMNQVNTEVSPSFKRTLPQLPIEAPERTNETNDSIFKYLQLIHEGIAKYNALRYNPAALSERNERRKNS